MVRCGRSDMAKALLPRPSSGAVPHHGWALNIKTQPPDHRHGDRRFNCSCCRTATPSRRPPGKLELRRKIPRFAMRNAALMTGLLALGIIFPCREGPRAAENATGLYLLGGKTSMAGFVPPPGTYVTDINLYYSGKATGAAAVGIALRRSGNLTIDASVEVQADAYVNAPIALWIAPQKVWGGTVG